MQQTVTLLKGDGIGPEIADAVREIIDATGAPITWEEAEAGLDCYHKHGTPLPQETLEIIKRNKVALKSPTTTPVGTGHKSVNVAIRKSLDLFANVRPAKSLPGVHTRYSNVDIWLVRENVEDTYAGIEYMQTPDVAQSLKIITRPGSEAIMRYTFEMARAMNRKRVTCVHKANIHKMSDGLFLECFREMAKEYPDLYADDIIVDNACMQLVTKPEQFDVMVLPNLYGDIVSDLCAGLIGGLGVAPGGNIGTEIAVFEAVHGSAPDIAGKGLANPTALLLSGIQMLQHIGFYEHASRIEDAMRLALVSGIKTRDLGGNASTKEFTRAIIAELPKQDDSEYHEPNPVRYSNKITTSKPKTDWKLVGTDVFVQSATLPDVPTRIGKFELQQIANRGTAVTKENAHDILLVDVFRCRYMATEDITEMDILDVLREVTSAGWKWMHVENLHNAGKNAAYSKA